MWNVFACRCFPVKSDVEERRFVWELFSEVNQIIQAMCKFRMFEENVPDGGYGVSAVAGRVGYIGFDIVMFHDVFCVLVVDPSTVSGRQTNPKRKNKHLDRGQFSDAGCNVF
jgi:hypothetical protein